MIQVFTNIPLVKTIGADNKISYRDDILVSIDILQNVLDETLIFGDVGINIDCDFTMEQYQNTSNVFFRVDDPNHKNLVPVLNSLYRALLSLKAVTVGLGEYVPATAGAVRGGTDQDSLIRDDLIDESESLKNQNEVEK